MNAKKIRRKFVQFVFILMIIAMVLFTVMPLFY